MIYIISEWVPYEGMHEVFQGTKEECIDWYNKTNNRPYLDDLTVYIEGPDAISFFTNTE